MSLIPAALTDQAVRAYLYRVLFAVGLLLAVPYGLITSQELEYWALVVGEVLGTGTASYNTPRPKRIPGVLVSDDGTETPVGRTALLAATVTEGLTMHLRCPFECGETFEVVMTGETWGDIPMTSVGVVGVDVRLDTLGVGTGDERAASVSAVEKLTKNAEHLAEVYAAQARHFRNLPGQA